MESGIIEILDEGQQLLDNIVLATDEAHVSRRAERDERTEVDSRPQQALKNVRIVAVLRVISAGQACTWSEDTLGESTLSKRGKKSRCAGAMDNEEDANRALFMQKMADHKLVELKRIKIAEKKLQLQKEHMENEVRKQKRYMVWIKKGYVWREGGFNRSEIGWMSRRSREKMVQLNIQNWWNF